MEKLKTGTMICFDREFPESARAYENMVCIATVNYPSDRNPEKQAALEKMR